ncbi:vomeronasal type-2 receptor 26-like [Anomaloglossus baeobatrachus]
MFRMLALFVNFYISETQDPAAQCHLEMKNYTFEYKYSQDGDFILGGIFTVHSWVSRWTVKGSNVNNQMCSGAHGRKYVHLLTFLYAIEEINNRSDILPNMTLGYHMYDSCGNTNKVIKDFLQILSGHSVTAPNYSCMENDGVVGFIGDLRSVATPAMVYLLGLYGYPQISYGASESFLSERRLHPNLFRAHPDDNLQFAALLKLLERFQWNWVGIFTSDDDNGQRELQYLTAQLLYHQICVAFNILVSNKNYKVIPPEFLSSQTHVIIISGTYSVTYLKFLYNVAHALSNKTLIFSLSWTLAKEDFIFQLSDVPTNCILGFSVPEHDISGMQEYISKVQLSDRPSDMLLEDIWMILLNCFSRNELKNRLFPLIYRFPFKNCSLDKRFHDRFIFDQDPTPYQVYIAVLIMAQALHDMKTVLNIDGKYSISSHNDYRHRLTNFIERVYFQNTLDISVNKKGELLTPLYITNWIRGREGSYETLQSTRVGIFDSLLPVQLNVTPSKIKWRLNSVGAMIDFYLKPLVSSLPSYLRDTTSALQRLNHVSLGDDMVMVTADVESLYTSIRHEDGLRATALFLNMSTLDKSLIKLLLTLLEFVLTHNVFLFKGKYFLQAQGTAMGASCAPSYANLFLGVWEQDIFMNETIPEIMQVKELMRFIDDVWFIWEGSVDHLDTFIGKLNHNDLNSKLTYKYGRSVEFLDIMIDVSNEGEIITNMYRKPTSTNTFLHASSSHPASTIRGIPIPEGRCNKRCLPGTSMIKREGFHICCYDCTPCSETEIANSTDSESCQKCPDHKWPNKEKNKCIIRDYEFVSYDTDVLALVFSITSISLSLMTALVIGIYIFFWKSPIVRANNRNLSFVILISLVFSLLCVFLFIGRPVDITCMLRQVFFGISFTVAISSILAKTIIVCIAFKATRPDSPWRKCMGVKLPYSVVVVCSSIQIGNGGIWLSVSPPYQEFNLDYPGKIIIQCNEGSVLAFSFLLSYMGLLATMSFFLAFMVKTLPDIYNEAKYITFSMLVFCSVWICAIPAYLSSTGKHVVTVEIFAILASGGGILSCMFLPKCYNILMVDEKGRKRNQT